MKRLDLAETATTDTLERRVQAVEEGFAVLCKNVREAMKTMGDAFKAMAGGFTTYGVRVVDSEGRCVATLAPGGDGGGHLVLYDPETGSEVAFAPPSLDKRTLDGDKPSADAGMGKPRDEGRASEPPSEFNHPPGR
ncbi:MAG: hypothetical protein V1790_13470 [Planctomycetota bacterium]